MSRNKRSLPALFLITAVIAALFLVPGCSWFGGEGGQSGKKPREEPERLTCPLCGSEVADRSAIDRRPVAVKVENDPDARPQSGLDKAGVVYEEITEGGITRFIAIYLCRDADPVGPIRSARPADIDIIYPYDALFCHCGGAPKTLGMIKQSKIADLDEFVGYDAYWRFTGRRAPHNLYAGTAQLRRAGDAIYPFEGEVDAAFEFLDRGDLDKMAADRAGEMERAGAEPAGRPGEYQPLTTVVNNIYIPYTGVCKVQYTYDIASGKFLRFVAGLPHTDLTTGGQLSVDTVIVQYVTVSASGIVDVRGADSPDLGVAGSGRAQVFMMGQLIDANWEKASRGWHTRYLDNSGNEIKLKPGSVWIQLVPATEQVSID